MVIHARLIDLFQEKIYPVALEIAGEKIKSIAPIKHENDLPYLFPGFVDAHVHIESSMMVPAQFARLAVCHGTVATVSDPHEIANVLGVEGVDYMIENGKQVNFKFFFGAPSCVPATPFETAGAQITAQDLKKLLKRKEILYLAEMMNWPGVLQQDPEVMEKLEVAKQAGKVIDGHAPGLKGEEARRYIEAGMSTDHECFTREEAEDKLRYGMKIAIREGSAARNFEALADLIHEHSEHMMFCSDDKHPDSLLKGHINELAARSIAKGIDLFKVLKVACLNPVLHYQLPVGLCRVGDPADFVLCRDLTNFGIEATYIRGKQVSAEGKSLLAHTSSKIVNTFNSKPQNLEQFFPEIQAGTLRVIEVLDQQLITREYLHEVLPNQGLKSLVKKDILPLVVVNRYHEAPIAKAWIKNFGLKKGAIASSVAHDSHNIIAVGVDEASLCKVVNLVIENKGGISLVDGSISECLPLPVAGLMSEQDGYQVAKAYEDLDRKARALGSQLSAPFMSLSFMALLVIPDLKLSDKGLFSGKSFSFVSKYMEKNSKKNKKSNTEDESGNVESLLAELGKKIDELIKKAEKASAGVREEILDKAEDLKKEKARIEDDLKRFRDSKKWRKTQNHLENALMELKKAVSTLFKSK